jgi:competence protein ComEA
LRFAVAFFLVLNLNTATPKELESLPGVGPVLARRIIEFREKKGGFRRIEELLAIPGISEQKWKAIKEKVVVGESKER